MPVAINRSILLITLLFTLALPGATQTNRPSPSEAAVRPVKKLPSHLPTVAEIQFAKFEFLRLYLARYGPSPWPIPHQPSKGSHYYVEPTLYGEEAIATAKFEAVDEQGALIAIIPIIKRNDPNGKPDFFGMMLVPNRPFRIVVSGQAVDGSPYKRIYERLFMPRSQPEEWESLIPRRTRPAEVKKMKAAFEDTMRQQYLKVKQEFDKLSGGIIVMPRTRVSNVNYAPLLSPLGRPRGLRITYQVEFSEDGYYNPELHVFPNYENEEWRGKVDMHVLDGNIEPKPIEESPQVRPNPVAYGAGYEYRGGTTYHITVELVPNYVIQNAPKTKFCLYNQKFNDDPGTRAVWSAILASKAPVKYRVYIQNSDFHGIIENFYTQHDLYNTFVAEGARDCGPQPTSRF